MAIQSRLNSFNSFEDETNLPDFIAKNIIFFQFLWGWNTLSWKETQTGVAWLSIPLRMKQNSIKTSREECASEITLSIPLRMKLLSRMPNPAENEYFQFLWGWNSILLPLSYSSMKSFNSFEDETWDCIHNNREKISHLSIPLRMKPVLMW